MAHFEQFSASSSSSFPGVINVQQRAYGAVGDGVEDDTDAINAALSAASEVVFVPAGTYSTTITDGTISKRIEGDGQIKTGSNKRGRYLSYVTSAPSSNGNHSSILTAFNGDVSKVQFLVEHRITGSATLGQPTSGYRYTAEAYPFYGYLYNSSGYNHSTSTNSGRTSACFFRTKIYNAGQGDCVAYNASAFVNGAKSGATTFLSNPAASLFNGDITAGANGVYLNPGEIFLDDAGFDVTGIGWVINTNRTNGAGALETFWAGYLSQSKGAESIDAHFSGNGPAKKGIDFAGTTFDSDKAAVVLPGNARIYLNASNASLTKYPDNVTLTNDYIAYDTATSTMRMVVNNTAAIVVKTGGKVNMANLPTSASGLASGDLWNDSGDLKIA